MQSYRIECNSLCKRSCRANHLTFPKRGKGDRRLTAVDEDVRKMLIKFIFWFYHIILSSFEMLT